MITVAYSTRKENPEFSEYLRKSSGFKKIEVIEKINNGEKSLSSLYNEILDEAKNDIVVFCHDDIYFDTNSWYNKLIKHFEKSDYGILGLAGSTYIPSSGKWWEDRRKMIGIVNHEHEGKKWVSKYSNPTQNNIEQSIIVDGLFIAVHKKRIKKTFVEEFRGFHFYDIPFCLENFLSGVKVGVIYNIRVTHKSIGMTNESWESNRQLFVNKYAENLPLKLKFNSDRKLRILISCLFFSSFTGSEIYVFELAKQLVKLNCDVTILSQIGGPITEMAKKLGIKCLSFEEPPGFKVGDGIWGFDTPGGFEKSLPNSLYKVKEVDFDVIHIQHKPVAEKIVQLYPNIPKVYTIHSEVISLEEPIKHDSIKKYIAIRPEIKSYISDFFEIQEESIEVIYNPIDENKFSSNNSVFENYILFVGTIDYLRKDTIFDILNYTKQNNLELWIVGENKSNYLDLLINEDNVKYFKPTWEVEKFVKNCKEVAGVQLGRTTIEGWIAGKPAWIYTVDSSGNILEKNKFDPPTDIDKYYSYNVAKKIISEYIKLI